MILKDYDLLVGKEIDLKLFSKNAGDISKGFSPEYKFQILLHDTNIVIGHINARIGDDEKVVKYIGHIGYGVDESYRGHKCAAKACGIVKKVFNDHSMDRVIITCNPDNHASRKTCEIIRAKLIEIIDIPTTSNAHSPKEAQKCRYEWRIK